MALFSRSRKTVAEQRPAARIDPRTELKAAWPRFPEAYSAYLRQRYGPALDALAAGHSTSGGEDDLEMFVGNMSGVWFSLDLSGRPEDSARTFYDNVVAAIGPSAEVGRNEFAARAKALTDLA